MQVIKRTGEAISFDISKIYDAINKAFREVRNEDIPEDLKEVVKYEFIVAG